MRKERKILDEVSDHMRLHHYSIHTERFYCDWIRRYILFHRMSSRKDLGDGERKIELFLTHLAVDGNMSPAAQNQAMNALVFFTANFSDGNSTRKLTRFARKKYETGK